MSSCQVASDKASLFWPTEHLVEYRARGAPLDRACDQRTVGTIKLNVPEHSTIPQLCRCFLMNFNIPEREDHRFELKWTRGLLADEKDIPLCILEGTNLAKLIVDPKVSFIFRYEPLLSGEVKLKP